MNIQVDRVVRQIVLASVLLVVVATSGCTSGDIDITNSDPRFSILRGRCFKTGALCFMDGDSREAAGTDGLPASIESAEKLDAPFRGKLSVIPIGTEFKVLSLHEIRGDTGGDRMDAVFLNGPFKGGHVETKYLFYDDWPRSQSFVVRPFLIPCGVADGSGADK